MYVSLVYTILVVSPLVYMCWVFYKSECKMRRLYHYLRLMEESSSSRPLVASFCVHCGKDPHGAEAKCLICYNAIYCVRVSIPVLS